MSGNFSLEALEIERLLIGGGFYGTMVGTRGDSIIIDDPILTLDDAAIERSREIFRERIKPARAKVEELLRKPNRRARRAAQSGKRK